MQMKFSGWSANGMQNIALSREGCFTTRQPREYDALRSEVSALALGADLISIRAGTLYVGDYAVDAQLSQGEKTLLSLDEQLLVMPDKLVVNTSDLTCGPVEVAWQGECRMSLCAADGTVYTLNYQGAAQPAAPAYGEYWVDTAVSPAALRRFNPNGNWTVIPDTCIRLEADALGDHFAPGDCLEVYSGILSGAKTVRARGINYIVVDGIMGQSATEPVVLRRTMPDMDYIFSCGDRLWGCRWEMGVNAIYCSRPGDCKNWLPFDLSQDSPWSKQLTSPGAFTGAAAMGSTPVFFKENWLHKVTGANPGSFRVESIQCPGVMPGCSGSPAVAGDKLYYSAYGGIMEYTGSGAPRCILPGHHLQAHGGGVGDLYYLSCRRNGKQQLLVYDTKKGLWCREDDLAVSCMTCYRGSLYGIANGYCIDLRAAGYGNESDFAWYLESDTGYPELCQLVSHVEARLRLIGSIKLSIRYDGGQWETLLEQRANGEVALSAPTRCRGCKHFQLRLEGVGAMTLHRLSAYTHTG